jgi:hypothetical protein
MDTIARTTKEDILLILIIKVVLREIRIQDSQGRLPSQAEVIENEPVAPAWLVAPRKWRDLT